MVNGKKIKLTRRKEKRAKLESR